MQFRHRKKGRKLFTGRDRNRRIFSRYHPMRSALGGVLTVVLLALLGLVGYNIIGPLVTRLSSEAKAPTKTDQPFFEQESEPIKTAPTETTAAASQTQTVTTTVSAATAEPQATEHTSRFGEQVTLAYCITPETVSDLKLLDTAAEQYAARGYSALVLPMKLSGGALLYASAVPEAAACGASADDAPAPDAVTAVLSRHGLAAVAQMDLLGDNLFPAAFSDGAFLIAENQKRWLDRAEADGGKPWISPYSSHSASYLSALASELVSAGFRTVLCQNLQFPHFYSSDESLLGRQVTDKKRRTEGLTGLMNSIAEQVPEAVLTVSLDEVLRDKAEVFDPEKLTDQPVCMTIDFSKFKSAFMYQNKRYALGKLSEAEKTVELLGLSRQAVGERKLIPCFVRGSLSDEQLDTVLTTAFTAGYDEIYVTD